MELHFVRTSVAALVLALGLPHAPAFSAEKEHKMVIHVSESSEPKMIQALNIVEATSKLYRDRGERLVVEIVTNGPGLDMLRSDRSPVRKRISLITTEYDDVRFSACANTMANMKKKEGREIPLLSEAVVVPGGVFRIMELTEAGYRYIRP